MNQELDYAEMLEIPVSTVQVVKKKSVFKNPFARKNKANAAQTTAEEQVAEGDLKDLVVDSVNERVSAFVYAEDVSDPPKPEKRKRNIFGGDRGSKIIITELVAVCVLAAAIFLTNVFMPSSAINTFIGNLASPSPKAEPTYSEIKLSSIVSENLEDANVTMTESGVLCFTGKSSIYPVCEGTISSVTKDGDFYSVQIKHTSTFSSVVTGLSDVYAPKGSKVKSNVPFAYTDGESEVRVSMYDGETLLNCYTLSGEIPVWNS